MTDADGIFSKTFAHVADNLPECMQYVEFVRACCDEMLKGDGPLDGFFRKPHPTAGQGGPESKARTPASRKARFASGKGKLASTKRIRSKKVHTRKMLKSTQERTRERTEGPVRISGTTSDSV